VVEIHLPPLRMRKECIPLLVHHFLIKFREKLDKKIINISDQAMEILTGYPWPGNVRELSHVIERACVLCTGKSLLQEHISDEIQSAQVFEDENRQEDHEKQVSPGRGAAANRAYEPLKSEVEQITEVLRATGGNKSKAAKILGVDRSTLYRKMKRYKL